MDARAVRRRAAVALADIMSVVAVEAQPLLRATWAELADFRAALQAVVRFGLTLDVEFVPGGRTVGTEWIVGPFCPNCKNTMVVEERACGCCGRPGRAHPELRRKRIGYRPFLQLSGIVAPHQLAAIRRRLTPRASDDFASKCSAVREA
jgi:hypothetical protein